VGETFSASLGEPIEPRGISKLYIGGYDPLKTDEWQQISLVEDLGSFESGKIEADLIPVEDATTPELRAAGSMWVRFPEGASEADIVEAANMAVGQPFLSVREETSKKSLMSSASVLSIADLEVRNGQAV
jgi:hypothetical protein